MQEQKILRAIIEDRQNFDNVYEYLDDKEFSPQGSLILKEIHEYYEVDQHAPRVDIEILNARLERRLPNPKHAQECIGIVKSLPDVSGANVVQEVLDLKIDMLGLELGAAIGAGKPKRDVLSLVERYGELAGKDRLDEDSKEITNLSVKDLLGQYFNDKDTIQIAPKSLNDRLDGGARPGHHVLVFAPTEMGKTLFVINMVAHFLRQKKRVLYVGNEDPASDIILRIITRLSGMDKQSVKSNPDKAQGLCDEANYGLLTFADLAPGTFPRVRSLIKRHRPDVVVLDQLSNINVNVGRSESKSGSLEEAAKQARGLAKRFGVLMVSVSQAADSATGKIVLGRGDVHNSNIGIPGQVDLMLGIGADQTMEGRGLREISLVKNKISGNHDHFTVNFDPIHSRVA
jgi:archaellum biogenesis ATPase FlaH